jgi:HK97 family phage major capsid protein
MGTKDEDLKTATELAAGLEKAADEIKQRGEQLQKEMKTLGEGSAETKKAVDDAMLKFNEMNTQHSELCKKHGEAVSRITELEQKLVSQRDHQYQPERTLGEVFVEDEKVKSFNSATRGSVRVQINRKDIMNVTATTGSVTSPANSLVGSMRVPGVVAPPNREMTIRDLLAPGQTSQGSVEYVKETGFTNNAAVVTEGSTKPTSDLTFELATAPVRTIAHLFKASRQILDDAPALRSYINARAVYGLRYAEEAELLNGDGTGAHILGLVPQATAFNAQFVATNKQRIDTIRLAILQVMLAQFPATGIVLHPTDWAQIQLLKDGDQRYLIGNPADGNTPRLWNLPVVQTQAMDATEFLVGNFNLAAQVFDRMEIEVLLSTEHSEDFAKNMVTIRAEERLALAVYRPAAIVTGDFDTAT